MKTYTGPGNELYQYSNLKHDLTQILVPESKEKKFYTYNQSGRSTLIKLRMKSIV